MFTSILFPGGKPREIRDRAPDCLRDLNLDQVLGPIVEKNPDLGPAFYTLLRDPETVAYRQEVLQDLTEPRCRDLFAEFAREITDLEACLQEAREDTQSGDPWRNSYLTRGRILSSGERYCRALETLLEKLPGLSLKSRGLLDFRDYLLQLCRSEAFGELRRTQVELRRQFDGLQYAMLIKNGTVRVRPYAGEPDLSREILRTFERFRQDPTRDYRQELPEKPYARHVEAGVLSCLARIYPRAFQDLDRYVRQFSGFPDRTVLQFCREIRFYLLWLKRVQRLQDWGLPFCIPRLAEPGEQLYCRGFFDLALGEKLGSRTVCNDFTLQQPERIFVITGPNQGGKTTFARAFGQLHYLAGLGLCVPGREACLQLPDRVLTHFEREEDLTGQSGKLKDDLKRLHSLLEQTTDRSVAVINEIFASTTAHDALRLGNHMMDRLAERGALCAVVTFLDELSAHGPETVSLMSTVDPENAARRTFRVVRRPADGRACAMSLAAGHGLTYEQLLRRIRE